MFTINNENLRIKGTRKYYTNSIFANKYQHFILIVYDIMLNLAEVLGEFENAKAEMCLEIETLRKEIFEKDSSRENIYEEIKSKVQHWKV